MVALALHSAHGCAWLCAWLCARLCAWLCACVGLRVFFIMLPVSLSFPLSRSFSLCHSLFILAVCHRRMCVSVSAAYLRPSEAEDRACVVTSMRLCARMLRVIPGTRVTTQRAPTTNCALSAVSLHFSLAHVPQCFSLMNFLALSCMPQHFTLTQPHAYWFVRI